MNYLKIGVWLLGVGVVFWVMIYRTEYAAEAAKAVMLLMGENAWDGG
jgi:hypothetical protein